MKKLIFSFIVVATAILVSCNEEFEEVTTIDIPNYIIAMVYTQATI